MFAYSLFINLYLGVLGYLYSKDRREWWDLTRAEKDDLLSKHLPEGEYTDEPEGTFPVGWFDLEDWEKKAIMDKNLEEPRVSLSVSNSQVCSGRGCIIA